MEPEKMNQRIVVQEGVSLVTDGGGRVIAMIRRDPESRKSLIYMVSEANVDEIATKVLK